MKEKLIYIKTVRNILSRKINIRSTYKIMNEILFKFMIIGFLFPIPLNNKMNFIRNNFSNITVKINGTGHKKIFSDSIFTSSYPKQVYINGIRQNIVNYTYDLNETENLILLVWNDGFNGCNNMFSGCKDISEIDVSNFNFSTVTDFSSMFSRCSNLTSISFSNFYAPKAKFFDYMFSNCSRLGSIDLSNFKMSSPLLTQYMFNNCTSLSSINLSNFRTSNIVSMDRLFSGCSSLSSINLSNFDDIWIICLIDALI